jgi:hypothetical protein
MYGKYEALNADSTEVAFVEDPPKRELAKPNDFPQETLRAARLLGDSFGIPQERAYQYLSKTDYSVPHVEGEEYDFIPNDNASAFVSQCVAYREESTAGQELVDDVREGRVTLTRRELVLLAGIRDSILEEQSLDAMDYADGQDWIPMTEQRHCEICGQFIGLRTSHVNCSMRSEIFSKVKEAAEAAGWVRADDLSADLFTDGNPVRLSPHYDFERETVTSKITLPYNKRYHKSQKIRKPLNLTEDEMQDLYCTSQVEWGYYSRGYKSLYQRDVLLSYFKKPIIGDPKITLPHGIRKAFVEMPVRTLSEQGDTENTIAIVAALIDPPLQKHEIEHIIDVGGPVAAKGLLLAKRTQADALEIITNYPSHAGAALAYEGTLSQDTIKSMLDSPDPRVQREAAMSPNLTEEDVTRIISNPDPDVRRVIISVTEGFAMNLTAVKKRESASEMHTSEELTSSYLSYVSRGPSMIETQPALLNTFLSSEEPDDTVAMFAMERAPLTRQILPALTQVRSRTRLQKLRTVIGGRTSNVTSEAKQIKVQALKLIDRRLAS